MRIVSCPKKPFTPKADEKPKPFLVLSPVPKPPEMKYDLR